MPQNPPGQRIWSCLNPQLSSMKQWPREAMVLQNSQLVYTDYNQVIGGVIIDTIYWVTLLWTKFCFKHFAPLNSHNCHCNYYYSHFPIQKTKWLGFLSNKDLNPGSLNWESTPLKHCTNLYVISVQSIHLVLLRTQFISLTTSFFYWSNPSPTPFPEWISLEHMPLPLLFTSNECGISHCIIIVLEEPIIGAKGVVPCSVLSYLELFHLVKLTGWVLGSFFSCLKK